MPCDHGQPAVRLEDSQRISLWVNCRYGSVNRNLYEVKVGQKVNGAGREGADDTGGGGVRQTHQGTDLGRFARARINLEQGRGDIAASGIEVAQLKGCPRRHWNTRDGRIHHIIPGDNSPRPTSAKEESSAVDLVNASGSFVDGSSG